MNNTRRKKLRAIMETIDTARSNLEELKDEEDDCLMNMPENLEGSERYEKIESAVYALEEAVSSLEDAVSSIEEAIE